MDITTRLIVILPFIAVCSCGCADPCANTIISETGSPDGRLKAIVFRRDCGATTDFSAHVSVVDSDERVLPAATLLRSTKAGNVFVADTDHGSAPSAAGGGPPVKIDWVGPKRLRIIHDERVRVFKAEKTIADVEIEYSK